MNELNLEDCINRHCPMSGKPVSADSLTLYKGRVVGFCNPGCRDTFDKAVNGFEAVLAQESGHPWVPDPEDETWNWARGAIAESYDHIRSGSIAPASTAEQTHARIAATDLTEPVGLQAAAAEAYDWMKEGDLLSASARCFGYFNPTPAWPGVVADLLAAARNPQVCVVSHAPASVAMERHLMSYLIGKLGFPGGSFGNFTSGGSEANATGLLVALVRAQERFPDDGLACFPGRPLMYASADSHLVWIKIAKASGLGADAVRLIPTDGRGRIDPSALRQQVQQDQEAGHVPLFLGATAGTTNGGEIDPIGTCRAIADEYGMHLHVDAAWAGALILDPTLRSHLAGIETADSVTIDAHKWLSVPMGAGMVFVRDRAAVARAYAVQTGYMPEGDGEDAYTMTSQWSRRFLGLRLWMMLRSTGPQGYAEVFQNQFVLAESLRQALTENDWTIRNHSALPLVLFEDGRHGLASQDIGDALEADRQTWLGCVDYEGRSLLRACLTSFLSGADDIRLLVDRLNVVRDALAG